VRRPHRTATKNVYDQAAWPSLTVIRCAVGKVAGHARRVSNRSQCGPREDTAVAFCEVGESLFAAFLLAACTDGLRSPTCD